VTRATRLSPEVLEPHRCELSATHGALDVLVPQVSLKRPCVVAGVGTAAGRAKHVGMNAIKPSSGCALASATASRRHSTKYTRAQWLLLQYRQGLEKMKDLCHQAPDV
jgi:hypothetical protein